MEILSFAAHRTSKSCKISKPFKSDQQQLLDYTVSLYYISGVLYIYIPLSKIQIMKFSFVFVVVFILSLKIQSAIKAENLTFMGPCIVNIFLYISNKIQLYTVYLYPETALRISGGTSTHHQECIQLYLQHLVFVTPLLLPAASGS